MKLKYIPNILTILRVVLSVALIFIYPILGLISFIVYVIAGVTDMIDGPLARRIPDGKTKFGTGLDSFADMAMIVVGVFVLLPAMRIEGTIFNVVLVALAFKILSASLSGFIKHRQVLFVHTTGNKLAAFFLFIAPIIFFFSRSYEFIYYYMIFIIIWVFVVTIEEALINLTLKKPNTTLKGIWQVRAENRRNL